MKNTDKNTFKLFVGSFIIAWLVSVGATIIFFVAHMILYAILFLILTLGISYYTMLVLIALAHKNYPLKTLLLIAHDSLFFISYFFSPMYVIVLFLKNGDLFFIIPCGIFVALSHFVFIPYLQDRIRQENDKTKPPV